MIDDPPQPNSSGEPAPAPINPSADSPEQNVGLGAEFHDRLLDRSLLAKESDALLLRYLLDGNAERRELALRELRAAETYGIDRIIKWICDLAISEGQLLLLFQVLREIAPTLSNRQKEYLFDAELQGLLEEVDRWPEAPPDPFFERDDILDPSLGDDEYSIAELAEACREARRDPSQRTRSYVEVLYGNLLDHLNGKDQTLAYLRWLLGPDKGKRDFAVARLRSSEGLVTTVLIKYFLQNCRTEEQGRRLLDALLGLRRAITPDEWLLLTFRGFRDHPDCRGKIVEVLAKVLKWPARVEVADPVPWVAIQDVARIAGTHVECPGGAIGDALAPVRKPAEPSGISAAALFAPSDDARVCQAKRVVVAGIQVDAHGTVEAVGAAVGTLPTPLPQLRGRALVDALRANLTNPESTQRDVALQMLRRIARPQRLLIQFYLEIETTAAQRLRVLEVMRWLGEPLRRSEWILMTRWGLLFWPELQSELITTLTALPDGFAPDEETAQPPEDQNPPPTQAPNAAMMTHADSIALGLANEARGDPPVSTAELQEVMHLLGQGMMSPSGQMISVPPMPAPAPKSKARGKSSPRNRPPDGSTIASDSAPPRVGALEVAGEMPPASADRESSDAARSLPPWSPADLGADDSPDRSQQE